MSTEFDDDEILGKLKTHRKNILLELRRNGETLTGNLRKSAGIPVGSKNYHLELLQEWGLIEVADRADDGERVFSLTDEGHSFVDRHLSKEDEKTELEQRVRDLEREVAELEEEKADRDDMKEYLTETYWSDIEDFVERRIGDET